MTGRLFSGGGPLDLVAALLSVRDGVIPATTGTADVPEDYQLDLVRDAPRAARLSSALVLGRGRWGFNSAVVVTAVAG
jgi:act minimal PKS chain-length factor (CLF/KS beta)